MTAPRPENRRPAPHQWRRDPDAHNDTACADCPLAKTHDVHNPDRVAAHHQRLTAAQHEHARRYEPGEDSDA